MADRCVCGSGELEVACCGPILDGAPPETALALMRSRYAAYVRGAVDHVVGTHDPETRAGLDPKAIARRSRDTEWQGLEILATEAGGPADDTGIVEFVARGVTRSTPFVQRERSRFRRVDGRWVYVDGKLVNDPIRRVPTAGRNDPCPCGSGMKYKRCHGA